MFYDVKIPIYVSTETEKREKERERRKENKREKAVINGRQWRPEAVTACKLGLPR